MNTHAHTHIHTYTQTHRSTKIALGVHVQQEFNNFTPKYVVDDNMVKAAGHELVCLPPVTVK